MRHIVRQRKRPGPLGRLPSPPVLTAIAALSSGVLVFGFLLVFSIAPYFVALPTKGASEAAFKAQLDRSVPSILRHFSIPGVVIATVIDGAPSKTYAYGFADLARARPMTADTVFRVASISKSLTAWGVLRLAQDGKVDLDAPAERYLPRWPLPPSAFPSKAVTVRALLNHTSGLNAGVDTFRRPDQRQLSPLELLRGQDAGGDAQAGPAALVGPAGQAFAYSVPGYTLLQMIIEAQTRQPFAAYMQNAVLRPLGMTSSSFAWDPALRPRMATPYLSGRRAQAMVIPQDTAADSLFSTAADLARFIAAPLPDVELPAGAGVLNADAVNQLYSDPSPIPSLELAGLGTDLPALGYFVEQSSGGPVIVTNGGYDPGWSSRFYIVPSHGDGVVILTNGDHGQPVIAQIASIWSSWRGLPPSKMTRAYRTLGLEADAGLSVVVMLDVSFGLGLLFELKSKARRWRAFHREALASSALECVLAFSVSAIWLIAHRVVQAMPALNAVGSSVIVLFTIIVLLRVACPAPAPMRAAAG